MFSFVELGHQLRKRFLNGRFKTGICYQSKKGIAITLFANGNYNLKSPNNNNIKLHVVTDYPADSDVKIEIDGVSDEEFEIKIRIPEFSNNTQVSVCGKTVGAVKGKYLAINRRWSSGDIINIKVDMSPRVIHPIGCEKDENSKNYIAVKYGPLVLARDLRISKDTGDAVSLAFDANGRINLKKCKTADFDTLCEFEVPLTDGSFTKMIDYQSAGKTLDEASLTEAWMKI